MDYRTGKCSQCGAEYKVPASFAHNVARCKKCKGVVHLSGAPSSGSSAATRATPPSASPAMPAKRVVPKPEAPRPAAAERKPTPAARPAPTPKPAGAPRGGALERIKSERRAAAETSEQASPSGASPSVERATGGAAAGRREKRPAREKRTPKEKKPPVAGIVSGAALVVVVAGVFLFKDSIFGSKESAATDNTAALAAPTPVPSTPEPEPLEVASDSGPASEESAEPEPKPKAAPKAKDPSSIDLAGIPDFQPTPDTSAEEWAQMNEWMDTWMDRDAGAAGNRARLSLMKETRRAVPAILNYFKRLDFATPDGRSNGDLCQKTLMEICNGTNFDWKYPDEAAGRLHDNPDDVWFCKRVVELWCNSWKQAEQSIEAWIKIAKLDEKAPEEAARLREMFGGQSAPVEPGSDDDLEVD